MHCCAFLSHQKRLTKTEPEEKSSGKTPSHKLEKEVYDILCAAQTIPLDDNKMGTLTAMCFKMNPNHEDGTSGVVCSKMYPHQTRSTSGAVCS
jgi:hypothetical protein